MCIYSVYCLRNVYVHSINACENMASFCTKKILAVLFSGGEKPSAYPTMTLPMKHLDSIPLFMSIAFELMEEFANRQIQLY